MHFKRFARIHCAFKCEKYVFVYVKAIEPYVLFKWIFLFNLLLHSFTFVFFYRLDSIHNLFLNCFQIRLNGSMSSLLYYDFDSSESDLLVA